MELWHIIGALAILAFVADLGIFSRKSHTVSLKEAWIWTLVWVTLAVLFGCAIWHSRGADAGSAFFAGYFLEKALSVDNLFVMSLVLNYFNIPQRFRHGVLMMGILGAIVLRGALIWGGASLIGQFSWLLYVMGGFLIWTAVKLLVTSEEPADLKNSTLITYIQQILPVTTKFDGARFFMRQHSKLVATPLFVALVAIELSDVVFALDSIPAIFGVTTDPFIIITSNLFAILGLRMIFFMLEAIIDRFHYLSHALSFILGFIGVKLCISPWIHIGSSVSLSAVGSALAIAVVASVVKEQHGS